MTLQFGMSNGDDRVSNLSTRFGVEPWDVEVGNRRDIQEIEVLEYRVLLHRVQLLFPHGSWSMRRDKSSWVMVHTLPYNTLYDP